MPENNKKMMQLLHTGKFQQFIQIFQRNSTQTKKKIATTNFYRDYIYVAIANLELGKFQHTQHICRQIIQEAPQIQDAYVLLAISLAYLKRYQQALSIVKQRLDDNNKKWKYYFAQGYVYTRMQKFVQATQSYGIAIIKNKLNNPKCYVLQAGSLAAVNQNQKAIKNITYAKLAIQEEQNKNCENLFRYEINNLKYCLKIYDKYMKKLKKAQQLKQISQSQRINFENSLIKIISKSVLYCNGNLKIYNFDGLLRPSQIHQKQSQTQEVDFTIKTQQVTQNFIEDMKVFQNDFKLKSIKTLNSEQIESNNKNTNILCEWMRQKCSIF